MILTQNLTFGYGKTPVLQNVSCEMPDGCLTALIGPNGAGKSTLLRLLARLETPVSGTVTVNGRHVRDYDSKSFAKMLAFLPQSRPTPMLSVRTLVLHGRFAHLSPSRRPSAQDEAAVDRALALTGMTGLQHRDVSTLSGGQRQKAYLAMAIAQEAQHILLDEPLTHLDVGYQLELMDILQTLKEEGRCIVMVLHDLSLLPKASDRVLLLHEGRLAFDGNAASLFESGAIEAAFGIKPVCKEGITFEKC